MNTSRLIQELGTIKDFIRWGYSYLSQAEVFFGHGTDNALDEVFTLVLHALHLPHDLPETYYDCQLTTEERQLILEWFRRRKHERIPSAYLTHEAWFAGLPFYVDERVLIPRSPVAEMIENSFAPWVDADHVHQVLDLCTGSGCIACASAIALPWAHVDASDISTDALAVAEFNVRKLELEDRVHLHRADLFSGLEGRTYDLIVSNPPYVSQQEMHALPAEYRHEPALGLEAGEQGLDCVHVILQQAAAHLNAGGVLIVEVGNSEAALAEAYPDVPFLWLEFTRGGEGVFLLTRDQLLEAFPST
jgi:ribosomal protein L3 glutamine methyltransferase